MIPANLEYIKNDYDLRKNFLQNLVDIHYFANCDEVLTYAVTKPDSIDDNVWKIYLSYFINRFSSLVQMYDKYNVPINLIDYSIKVVMRKLYDDLWNKQLHAGPKWNEHILSMNNRRVAFILMRNGLNTIGDVVTFGTKYSLCSLPKVGAKSFNVLKEYLTSIGYIVSDTGYINHQEG